MITPDEFMAINKGVKTGRIAKIINIIQRQGVKANLMRGCVFCGECDNPMASTITPHKRNAKSYFYYRCETHGCSRKNKGERAKVILDFASDYIRQNFKYTT
jgi:hypothetical protein